MQAHLKTQLKGFFGIMGMTTLNLLFQIVMERFMPMYDSLSSSYRCRKQSKFTSNHLSSMAVNVSGVTDTFSFRNIHIITYK